MKVPQPSERAGQAEWLLALELGKHFGFSNSNANGLHPKLGKHFG
jgi:hypothetical protein